MIDEFEWERNDALKIWCFGPDSKGSNVVVDTTVANFYLEEIVEPVSYSFQYVSKRGVLCEEPMRGIRFNIS